MKRRSSAEAQLCGCGCGKTTKKSRNGTFNSFLRGHNSKLPDNAGTATRWRPGESGNPQGCKTGSRNKVTVAAETIINGEAEALSLKLIELAKAGNVSCLLTAIKTLVPPKRSSPIRLPDMPAVDNVADAAKLTGYVLESVAAGKISPSDGEQVSRLTDRHLKALQICDLEQRLAELEQQLLAGQ